MANYTLPVVKCDTKTSYVSYKYYSPKTGKLERQRSSFNCNRIKDLAEREKYLNEKANELLSKLEDGYNPYVHEYDTYHISAVTSSKHTNIITALDIVSKEFISHQKAKGWAGSKTYFKQFREYLYAHDLDQRFAHEIDQQVISDFLAFKKKRDNNGLRTRFNYITFICNIFNYMERLNLIDENVPNPTKKINRYRKKSLNSTARIIYTHDQIRSIISYTTTYDPLLLDVIAFIGYGFLRPDSTIRLLQCHMIDQENWEFNIPGDILKSGENNRRIIQKALRPTIERMKLDQYPGDYYLFTKKGRPGPEPCVSKYFSRRFRKVKVALGLSKKHDMYAIRHTFATDLVRSGTAWHKIMKITGHSSLSSFEHYVKFIQAEQAEDLSDQYSIQFEPTNLPPPLL